MKNAFIYGGLLIVLFLVGFFIARINGEKSESTERTQILLGTVVNIQVRNADKQNDEEAITEAFSEIKRIDDLFSTYNENSPVWKINHSADSIIVVEDEIYRLMVECDSLWKISGHCFDAAIGTLMEVWGFDKRSPDLPDDEIIKSALKEIGWNDISLIDNGKVRRTVRIKLDFSAIAKGYAVDCTVEVLRKSGIKDALVNAGGEIKAIGNDWIIGVQHPRDLNSIIKKIRLSGMSVATSGDYENYFEKDGIRYHHILDPETGYPAKGIQSVTIINKENAFADGLATAVFVMGKEKGLTLIESLKDTEAMIIDEEGKIFYSTGFEKYLVN